MLPPALLARLRGRVFVLTGAGISAASGIRTFRGDEGLYRGLDPYALASPEGFASNPATVWNWYLMRIRSAWDAQPNAGHVALVELEKRAADFTLITTNVDPLHDRAGSRQPYRLHGNILETRCTGCGAKAELDPDFFPEEVDETNLPQCACGALLRPNVVWFGEYPWAEALSAVKRSLPQAHIYLEIGTSGAVTYHFDKIAVELGIPVIRINPDPRPEPGVTELTGPAEEILPALVAAS